VTSQLNDKCVVVAHGFGRPNESVLVGPEDPLQILTYVVKERVPCVSEEPQLLISVPFQRTSFVPSIVPPAVTVMQL
jgi:hypothetical protein